MTGRKRWALAALCALIVSISFINRYEYIVEQFSSTAMMKAYSIREHLRVTVNFLQGLQVYGSTFFRYGQEHESALYSLLKYDEGRDLFSLDAAGGTPLEKEVANLTGRGPIPERGPVRKEIEFALQCTRFFSTFYSGFSDVAWLYYTSESGFLCMYPWVSSADFAYSERLKSVEFFRVAVPENDPERKLVWTAPYSDEAGKGFMVTLSAPVYDLDTFKGVLSLDLTNDLLSSIIRSPYESYLVNDTGTVIVVSRKKLPAPGLSRLDRLLSLSPEAYRKLQGLEKGRIHWFGGKLFGGQFVYSEKFDEAPWSLYVLLPGWVIVGSSLLFTLPIILICILLGLSLYEIEKRLRAERRLADSLNELKSYQIILEKAAKYDYLTNTVNRRGLKEHFSEIVAGLRPGESLPVSFIIGDIDRFKQFNDTWGHEAGDRVLIETAELMKRNAGDGGTVCRWGGEEFVIMLPGKSYGEALEFAESLRSGIERLSIPWTGSRVLGATMTFGVEEGNTGTSVDASVAAADGALYVGKNSGRNRVVGCRDTGACGSAAPAS